MKHIIIILLLLLYQYSQLWIDEKKTKNNEEKQKQKNKQSEINQHLDLQRRNKKMHHKRAQKTKNPTKIHSSFKFCHVLWNKLSITFIDTILMLNSNKCIPSSHCQIEIIIYSAGAYPS